MDILQPIAAIVLVLALLAGTLYILRRRGIASFANVPSRQLAVLERLPLGGQHALHLVRVGERRILVATAPGVCQILDSPEGRDR